MNKGTEEERELIERLSKTLWLLEKRGYISTDDQESEADMNNLRYIGRQAVIDARKYLGLPELKK